MNYDAIIVGGGPAGLSAALVLGRCRRKVLVCDAGHPRNAASHGVHCFLTRDCADPKEVLRIAREQLKPYAVETRDVEVMGACKHEGGFRVSLKTGEDVFCRKLLLATGVKDSLPEIENFEQFYGKSAHHCPYCDGWEWRDQPIAVYGSRHHGYGLALSLWQWSKDITLLTDGPLRLHAKQTATVKKLGIKVKKGKLARMEGSDGLLERIVFEDGSFVECRALFFSTGQQQHCDIPEKFGCIFTHHGAVKTGTREQTNIPGLFVAGDASRDMQFVIVAAAEGTKAAEAINEELQKEDRELIVGSGER